MLNLTKTQKICIQYGFLLLLICMTVYLVSTTLDITLIPMIMKLVNKKFIFIGFLIMVLYIILECTIINILIKTIQKTKVRFLAVKIAMMGFYYNLITPFASGSQPMLIYVLNKYKVPLSEATGIITNKTLLIVVSQSGETADTLAVLRDAKKQGARVLAITNVVGSSVSREADDVFYTLAGPEIAVASTKAYVTQLAAFYILGLYFASLKGTMSKDEIEEIKCELLEIPNKIEKALGMKEELQKFASSHYNHKDMYFLGRGLDYAVAMEGSLKLKEISYIHCDAYAGGELKHGPIALIENNTAVITLLTQESLKDKMISNVREVSTRGGNIFAVVNEDDTTSKEVVDSIVYIPKTIDILTPLISVVPLQLISYYIAKQKGCDVDKPRNLAKSVTVE